MENSKNKKLRECFQIVKIIKIPLNLGISESDLNFPIQA